VNVYAKAPTAPAPSTATESTRVISRPEAVNMRRAMCVMVQNRNSMQNALARQFMALTMWGT